MHSGEVAGAEEKAGEEGRENPQSPEGWEGGRARPGNRGYLQRCPRVAVGLALAALALEPAAPPGALGHRGMALAGAPASPRPRGPGGWWLGAPQPGLGATLGWLRAGSGRGEPLGVLGPGGQSGHGVGRGRGGAPPAPGGRVGLLEAAVWLRSRSREEKGRRREGSFLKAKEEQRRGKHEEPRAGCGQEADVS